MGRAIGWLLVGVATFALLVLAVVPGALRDPSAVGELAMFAAIAGVPGVVLLVVLVMRRGTSSPNDSEGSG